MAANATCYIVCGDGFNVGSEECDDGNLVDGDGCNADCTLGNNNGCSATAPYRDPVTNNCTNTCPTGYFANATNYTCVACIYTC
jgi:cysteine-rich repeat protein